MFKKFGMLLLAACFLFSTQAEAGAADQIGVYVTPQVRVWHHGRQQSEGAQL